MPIQTTKKRVMVITGTRADYGLLKPVMQAIDRHPKLQLQVMVTGMHLLPLFGNTVKEVVADGWNIDVRIKLQGDKDDIIGQATAMGRAITKMAETFNNMKSDIVLLLGDRLEMFAAAAAATACQKVIAHIHGGDAAAGIQDDAYRFAISKLAHIHFAASQGSKNRLIRLGEQPFRIYLTGSPALDNLSKNICRNKNKLSKWAGFDINDDFIIILQHPAGASAAKECQLMKQTLRGCNHNSLKKLVLYPNCDTGFSGIISAINSYCTSQSHNNYFVATHLPREIFMGLLRHCIALVGNSSCGIIEAGRLNVDVINVGPRQAGRDRDTNVHDIDYGTNNVSRALEAVLRRRRSGRCKPSYIYGNGRSAIRIASILARVKLDEKMRHKKIAY